MWSAAFQQRPSRTKPAASYIPLRPEEEEEECRVPQREAVERSRQVYGWPSQQEKLSELEKGGTQTVWVFLDTFCYGSVIVHREHLQFGVKEKKGTMSYSEISQGKAKII